MRLSNPVKIVKAFNDCINNQDIDGLAALMSEDHTFIDRDESSHGPKSPMVEGWKQFFEMFPHYRNTFDQIKAEGNRVFVLGFAYWSEKEPYDPVIWTARIDNNLIYEWRIYVDSPENRQMFNF
jgi:predicted SnoaL-like aldol condensation-catalyzing enzyme